MNKRIQILSMVAYATPRISPYKMCPTREPKTALPCSADQSRGTPEASRLRGQSLTGSSQHGCGLSEDLIFLRGLQWNLVGRLQVSEDGLAIRAADDMFF